MKWTFLKSLLRSPYIIILCIYIYIYIRSCDCFVHTSYTAIHDLSFPANHIAINHHPSQSLCNSDGPVILRRARPQVRSGVFASQESLHLPHVLHVCEGGSRRPHTLAATHRTTSRPS